MKRHTCQSAVSISCLTLLTSKVCHGDLVISVREGSLVGLCMQDYKSRYAAVMICDTLTNIKTHTQTAF